MKVPLSYLQERLWFIDQFESGNSNSAGTIYYNIPLILHGHGRIYREQLAEAVRLLAATPHCAHGSPPMPMGQRSSSMRLQTYRCSSAISERRRTLPQRSNGP